MLFLYICKHLIFGAFLHVDEVEDIFWSNDHFATYHYITSWFIVWYASREQIWCGGAARARTLEVPAGGEIQVMAMGISRDMTPTRLLCLVNPVATGPANANGGAYTAIVLRNWSHWKALQSHNDSTWRFTVHSEVWGIKCINSIPIFSITCGLNMSIGTSCSQDFMRSLPLCPRQSLPQSMPTGRNDLVAQDLAWDPNKLGLFGICKSFPRVQKGEHIFFIRNWGAVNGERAAHKYVICVTSCLLHSSHVQT